MSDIVLVSDAHTESNNNGEGVIDTAGEIGRIAVVPVSANAIGVTIAMRIAIAATREVRDIE